MCNEVYICVLIRYRLFHPVIMLLIAAVSTSIFALLAVWRLGIIEQFLVYNVPVVFVFILFTLDRLEQWQPVALDVPVVALAIARAFIRIPLISGHALFLTYCVLTAKRPLVRGLAILVLLEVAYLKLVVWQDVTFIGGSLLGIGAALLYKRLTRATTFVPTH